MPSYRPCESDVTDLLQEVLRDYHPDLVEAGITVLCQFAHAKTNADGEITGHALKHHGYPALAVVSVTTCKDRVAGLPDARILIDGDRWPELSEEERRALLDHECQHLALIRGEDGAVKHDDASRPRLKLIPHDVELGVFLSVVKRHGKVALEAQSYRRLREQMKQMEFSWPDGVDAGSDAV